MGDERRDLEHHQGRGEEARAQRPAGEPNRPGRLWEELRGLGHEMLDDRAFARMRFSGRHTAPFRGFAPTGREVSWAGAALFRFADEVIAEIWVLGDLAGLDTLLAEQAELRPETNTRPSK